MILDSLSLLLLLAEVDWKWMNAFRASLKLQLPAADDFLVCFTARPCI